MKHQSLLWSLTPPDGQSSWLFGTMHIRDERAHQFSSSLYPLILQSDHFVGEMDLDRITEGVNLPFYNIHDFINEKKYKKLHHQLQKSFGLNIDQFTHLHPLMIMSIISTSVLQSEHMISLDEHLWQFAKQNNKSTGGLESYDEQLSILNSIEVGSLYNQILDIGQNPAKIRRNSDRSLKLYVDGKIHQLYKLSKASMQQLRKKVIYERNARMVDVICQYDKSLKYFITVGAGHLSGKFGLISLLKKRGFVLKPRV